MSQLQRGSGEASAPVFAFVEGALVSALRDGSWLLLDEINLAPNETLERLAGVLEVRTSRSVVQLCWSLTRSAHPCRDRKEA